MAQSLSKELLPPSVGGTGTTTLYESGGQGAACPLHVKLEHHRSVSGLPAEDHNVFKLFVINDNANSYVTGIRLVGTRGGNEPARTIVVAPEVMLVSRNVATQPDIETSISVFNNGKWWGNQLRGSAARTLLNHTSEDYANSLSFLAGGRLYLFQGIEDDREPLPEHWQTYHWTVELTNCRAATDKEMSELPRLIQLNQERWQRVRRKLEEQDKALRAKEAEDRRAGKRVIWHRYPSFDPTAVDLLAPDA